MGEREAFLADIAAHPEEDGPRLVFADWLEEHGEPDLAEFIRLQIELEPLRRPRADPRAELDRVRLLHKIPPGQDFPDPDSPLARKLDREAELLRLHTEWLGPRAALEAEHSTHFAPKFRRGFVASAQIGLSALLEHGADLRRFCPTLQHLVVFGTLGRGEALATCAALAGLPELMLAGWLSPADARALARSPHLAGLRELTVWIGPDGYEEVCRSLPGLPGLRHLTLVQMYGGLDADYPAELDAEAAGLAAFVNAVSVEELARVERPFARLFPLDGVHIGYGITAGYLPGGRPVLVAEGKRPVLMHFDPDGRLVREEQLDLSNKLVKPPAYSWDDCDVEELIEVLGREIGFEPGPIFVREFHSDLIDAGIRCWGIYEDELANPHRIDPEYSEDIGASLYGWWSSGQFVLPFGNSYWADGLGRIHTS